MNQSRRSPEGEKITLGVLGKALQGKLYLIQDSVGKTEFARMGGKGIPNTVNNICKHSG